MADIIGLTMYKNIIGKPENANNNSATSSVKNVSNLNSKEESMLVGLLNKSQSLSSYTSSAPKSAYSTSSCGAVGKKVTLSEMIKPAMNNVEVKAETKSASASDILSSMARPVEASKPQLGQKVDIQSLIGGIKTPKAANSAYDMKKSTTVTLNELVAKCKKSEDAPVATTVKAETGVKKSVIGNSMGIDSLIPKISLNSIGKSNSFFK
ncbi:MAG: hypothetical protein RR898_05195 [Clostridium sp.]|uniref:hypothetical protein n=1 Tax=Clostridium sp. TaxID=1506 RepID=UPI002FCBCF3D